MVLGRQTSHRVAILVAVFGHGGSHLYMMALRSHQLYRSNDSLQVF